MDGMRLYTHLFFLGFFGLSGSFFLEDFHGWLICFRGLYLYGCVTNPHCIGCRVGQGEISGKNCEKRGVKTMSTYNNFPALQVVNSILGELAKTEAIILESLGINGCSGIWSVNSSGCRGYVNWRFPEKNDEPLNWIWWILQEVILLSFYEWNSGFCHMDSHVWPTVTESVSPDSDRWIRIERDD